MNPLRRLQSDFQGYLCTYTGAMEDEIVGTETVDARTRLEIYATAYRLRLIEALEGDFIALRAQVGNEAFEAIARAYIDAHPSDHFSLRYFGRHLSRFLAETPPYCDDHLLSEIAAFEWGLTDAFDAADHTAATVEQMAAIAPALWPELTFTLHPSVVRLDLRWNAPVLWKAADQNQPLPEAQAAEYPIGWVLWRQDLQIYFRSLSVDQAWALDALRRGESFAALCEGLCEWIDPQNVAPHAAGLLKQWLTDGLIHKIHTHSQD